MRRAPILLAGLLVAALLGARPSPAEEVSPAAAGPVLEEEAVLGGHEGLVRVLDFSPDGTRLASGSADRTLRVWVVEGASPHLLYRIPPARGLDP